MIVSYWINLNDLTKNIPFPEIFYLNNFSQILEAFDKSFYVLNDMEGFVANGFKIL